jgi:hypothetical protein
LLPIRHIALCHLSFPNGAPCLGESPGRLPLIHNINTHRTRRPSNYPFGCLY